ncbi:MAG: mechanosensitive ion channel [Candidatus Brocadiia bacterium]|nr:MAG: mechanosensitive ion channel [Candidatus Brocadiia bacterium]
MDILDTILLKATDLIATGIAIVIVVGIIWAFRFTLNKRYAGISGHQFKLQLISLILSFVGLLVVILTLPVSETTIGQLLGLLGILLSAAIALSATTFVGNIMAGIMLRAIKNFRSGDFVRVGDHFGRISERGLFHIEIQTEDRDLTTLPNLYLVTNPVKVIRSSGTLVTAEVSLAYDVPRTDVEENLLRAATEAGLEEPFVHLVNLGDFSITYRLAGLLIDVKSLLSTRSNLRAKMADHLHQAGVEIISPSFMNQRILSNDNIFIPKVSRKPQSSDKQEVLPEAVVFDKAEEAESLEKLHERHAKLQKEIEELKSSLSDESDEALRSQIQKKIDSLKTRSTRLIEYIKQRDGGEE